MIRRLVGAAVLLAAAEALLAAVFGLAVGVLFRRKAAVRLTDA